MKTCEFCNNSFKDTYLSKHKKTAKYCIEIQKSKNVNITLNDDTNKEEENTNDNDVTQIDDILNLNEKIFNMENNIKNIYENLKIKDDISETAIEYIYRMNKIQNMLEIQNVKINEIINKNIIKSSDEIVSTQPIFEQNILKKIDQSTQVDFEIENIKFGNEISTSDFKNSKSYTDESNIKITRSEKETSVQQVQIPDNELNLDNNIILDKELNKLNQQIIIPDKESDTNKSFNSIQILNENNIKTPVNDTSDEDNSFLSVSENLTDDEKREFDEIEKQLFHHLKLVLGDKKLDISNIINIVIDLMKFIDYFNIVNKNKKEIILYTIKKYFNQIDYNEIHNQFFDVLPSIIDMFISIDKKKIKIRKPKFSCMFPIFS
jgi:hypothetical protein